MDKRPPVTIDPIENGYLVSWRERFGLSGMDRRLAANTFEELVARLVEAFELCRTCRERYIGTRVGRICAQCEDAKRAEAKREAAEEGDDLT